MILARVRGVPLAGEALGFGDLLNGHTLRNGILHLRLIPVEMYEAIPNSYLWIAPNSDHDVLMESERGRTRFVETALDFLSGAWERR